MDSDLIVTSVVVQLEKANPEAINIIDVMTPVREAVKEDVKAGIRTCMAENRA